MLADIDSAPAHHVGAIYVTDQTLPNPYAQLPSYWDQEVAEIALISVPEPDSLVIFSSVAMVVLGAVLCKRVSPRPTER
jgi:hypothetical protein